MLIAEFINLYYIDELIPSAKKFCSIYSLHKYCDISAYTIGRRQAEKRIKSVLNVKQQKRVNENSLNELLLNMFKRIELLPPTRDR